jgi:serine protease Do
VRVILAALAVTALIGVPAQAEQLIGRNAFRAVAKKVSPAVVNIRIKSNIVFGRTPGHIKIPPSFGLDPEMREYLERLFEQQMPNTPLHDQEEFKYKRSASGIILTPEGHVVTSNHVVARVEESDIEISLPDGRSFDNVSFVGRDELTDLAVLKIEGGENLPTVEWGDSEQLEVGDWVLAIGNPLDFSNSVSQGIVSAKHRVIRKAPIEDLIQTTAIINPGNSGGALVDMDGKLVGINMAIATSTGLWSGLGFAIPAKTARGVTEQIIERGKVARGYLGIQMAALTGNLAHQLGYDEKYGIVIVNVEPGTVADKAGLQRYDIIAKVDDREIREINDMHRNIGARSAGDTVELTVFRDEGDRLAEKRIKVTLGERPSQDELEQRQLQPAKPGVKPDKDSLGMLVGPNPDGDGVIVESVEPKSRAALAGIRKGDVIQEVNREVVNSAADVRRALKAVKKDGHLFYIERPDRSAFVTIPPK